MEKILSIDTENISLSIASYRSFGDSEFWCAELVESSEKISNAAIETMLGQKKYEVLWWSDGSFLFIIVKQGWRPVVRI